MDINSKKLQSDDDEKNKLWRNTLGKFKFGTKVLYVALALLIISIMIFSGYKRMAMLISLFIIMTVLVIKNIVKDFKDIALFQEIYEITNLYEDSEGIFKRTNLDIGLDQLLGKNYKSMIDELYKVERYIYENISKTKQSDNMSNELVVEVSKNLRNPVMNIEKSINELETNYKLYTLDELEKQSNILKHNIEELFELAKVITGNIDLDIKQIDIASLLKQALVEYEDKLNESNLYLKSNIKESRVFINADGNKTWRVFELLLDNIVQYSKEGSRVYVNLYCEKEYTTIDLINISKKELNMDKESFFNSIKNSNEASKMGLIISSSLISIQNGSLDIIIDGDMFKVQIKFKNE